MTATPVRAGRRSADHRAFPTASGRAQVPYRASGAAGRAWVTKALASAVGLVADRALGEPPASIHPVSAFGQAMAALERRVWRDSRPSGVGFAATGVALGCATGVGLDRAGLLIDRAGLSADPAGTIDRAAATIRRTGVAPGRAGVVSQPGVRRRHRAGSSLSGGAVATWLVVAGRALGGEARAIGDRLLDDDLDGARRRLPALVGRDPDSLDAKGVARAVVESVAENTVDAVVAPACWAALGGAPGAGFYRAVNTLDAMVGHRNERYGRFGWASARLDDVANWVPARLTALLVAAVRPTQARDVLDALLHPPAHPSPNAGVAKAAFAAALGLRLGGDTVYAGRVDPRPTFGTGRSPEPADINAAIRLSRDVTLALAALLAAPAVAIAFTRRHPGPDPAAAAARTNPR